MSRYESYLIKAGLIYLVLTGVLGLLFSLQPQWSTYFRTTHLHLGFLGFFLSLVMGVAFWMMPRPGGLRQEKLEAVTFYLHNAGLLLRLIAEPWWRYSGDSRLKLLTAISAMLLLAAIAVFVWSMWQRVKTKEVIIGLRRVKQAESG
nr:putative membrane protein [uncultured bacterium]